MLPFSFKSIFFPVFCHPWKIFFDFFKRISGLTFLLSFSSLCRIVAQTVEKFGRLDVLVFVQSDRFAITLFLLQVNNAGVLEMGTIETTSLEQYDRQDDSSNDKFQSLWQSASGTISAWATINFIIVGFCNFPQGDGNQCPGSLAPDNAGSSPP